MGRVYNRVALAGGSALHAPITPQQQIANIITKFALWLLVVLLYVKKCNTNISLNFTVVKSIVQCMSQNNIQFCPILVSQYTTIHIRALFFSNISISSFLKIKTLVWNCIFLCAVHTTVAYFILSSRVVYCVSCIATTAEVYCSAGQRQLSEKHPVFLQTLLHPITVGCSFQIFFSSNMIKLQIQIQVKHFSPSPPSVSLLPAFSASPRFSFLRSSLVSEGCLCVSDGSIYYL